MTPDGTSQVSGSADADRGHTSTSAAAASIGRGARRLVRGAGVWSAAVMPFVALALLVVQPTGRLPLVAGVFLANVVGTVAGHCHGRAC